MKSFNEFSAHSKKINCITLGKKTGTIIASGSDDCEIRIWKIRKNNPIICFNDIKKPITSLIFDQKEDTILAGTDKGTLVIYDLEKQEKSCRLGGEKPHLSSVTCLDSHPYSYFLASGSSDHSLKVWDVRSPTAIQTYHTETPISSVKFSPDGKIVSSGDVDGCIKLWNLTAGSCMNTMNTNGCVSSLEFHPLECLLVSGSLQIDLWDLDEPLHPQHIAFSNSTNNNNTSLIFRRKEDVLLNISNDVIKIWSWQNYNQDSNNDNYIPYKMKCLKEILISNSMKYASSDISFHLNKDELVFACTQKNKIKEYFLSNLERILQKSKETPQLFQKRTHNITQKSNQDFKRTKNNEKISIKRILHSVNDPITPTSLSYNISKNEYKINKNENKNESESKKDITPTSLSDNISKNDFLLQTTDTVRYSITGNNINQSGKIPPDFFRVEEEQLCSQLLKDHEKFLGILNHRLSTLRIIRKIWDLGDVNGVINILNSEDLSVSSEFLASAFDQLKARCTSDNAILLLPICNRLLDSKFISYFHLSQSVIEFLIDKFPDVIKDSKNNYNSDFEKCNSCKKIA